MTAKQIKPADWYPVHCAACIQAGLRIPATWLVTRGQGHRSYHACNSHREILETRGAEILLTIRKNLTKRAT